MDGATSATAFLSSECAMTGRNADAAVRMGRSLEAMPETRAAVADGRVSVDQARMLARAAPGIGLAAGYALERPRWIHTDLGFGLAWGGFPILVGYFGQSGTVGVEAVVAAGAATLVSLTQRALSTPARLIRRQTTEAEVRLRTGEDTERWDEERLLDTWEKPLRLLAWAMVALAAGLLIGRL
jgi:hypothetical protein